MDARGAPQRREIAGRAARGTGELRKTVRHWAISGATGPWLDKHQEDAAMWLEHLIG
jgi:hypothetical protein